VLFRSVQQLANETMSLVVLDKEPQHATWYSILPYLTYLLEEEREWYRRATIAELPTKKDQQRLKECPQDFSDEERKFLETVIKLRDELDKLPLKFQGNPITNFTALSKRKRVEIIQTELEQINEKRQRVLDRVTNRKRGRQRKAQARK
jgi:hypothetical protein